VLTCRKARLRLLPLLSLLEELPTPENFSSGNRNSLSELQAACQLIV